MPSETDVVRRRWLWLLPLIAVVLAAIVVALFAFRPSGNLGDGRGKPVAFPTPSASALAAPGVKPVADTRTATDVPGAISELRKLAGLGDVSRSGCLDKVAAQVAKKLVDTQGASSTPSDTSSCRSNIATGFIVGGDPSGVEQAHALAVRDKTGVSTWGSSKTAQYGYTVAKINVPGMQGYVLAWATAR